MRKYDTLIIGAGIAGLETAINLANLGSKVLIVEKEPFIGGNMIALSKVFPTLDCSSCITTPKMSEAFNHKNIEILTLSQPLKIIKNTTGFEVTIEKKPRFVDEKTCTACRTCENSCPVIVPHEFDRNLGARKAIYIPFTTAIPQKAVLNPNDCIGCGKCQNLCPTTPKAVDYLQKTELINIETQNIVIATGYDLNPITVKKEYGQGKFKNVITSFQLERILAPSGPYSGVLRPYDGKEPEDIAFVLCAGSRDKTIGVPYCSRVCCMYSIKQAMLISGSLPLANITVYYMDIRAFGKGYEQFYQNALAMGINFVKAKVAKIEESENSDLILSIEDLEGTGTRKTRTHDLAVLAQGIIPSWDIKKVIPELITDNYGFIATKDEHLEPSLTNIEGVYFAGTCASPKDIVDTILDAGGASVMCALSNKESFSHG